jgi:hypothetical protein
MYFFRHIRYALGDVYLSGVLMFPVPITVTPDISGSDSLRRGLELSVPKAFLNTVLTEFFRSGCRSSVVALYTRSAASER